MEFVELGLIKLCAIIQRLSSKLTLINSDYIRTCVLSSHLTLNLALVFKIINGTKELAS